MLAYLTYVIFLELSQTEFDVIIVHCVKSVQIRSFFWSVICRIRTEYREIRSISPYSFRMRENTDQKKLRTWAIFTLLMSTEHS